MYNNDESEVKLEELNDLDEYTKFATSLSCTNETVLPRDYDNSNVKNAITVTEESVLTGSDKPKEPHSWRKKYEHLNFNAVVTLEKIDKKLLSALNKRSRVHLTAFDTRNVTKSYANANVGSNSGTIQDRNADPITCRKCDESVANTENARWLHCLQHFTQEYDAKSYVCIFCELKCTSYRAITAHTRKEHYVNSCYGVDYNFDADMKLHQLAFECFLTPINKSACNNAIVIRPLKNGRPIVENTVAGPVLINLFQCLRCPGYNATRFRYLIEHFDFVHPHVRKLSHGVDYACHVQERPQQNVSQMEVSEELNIPLEQISDNNTIANDKIPLEQATTISSMEDCVRNGQLTINHILEEIVNTNQTPCPQLKTIVNNNQKLCPPLKTFDARNFSKPPELSSEPPVLSPEVSRMEHSNAPSSQPSEGVPVIFKIVPSTMDTRSQSSVYFPIEHRKSGYPVYQLTVCATDPSGTVPPETLSCQPLELVQFPASNTTVLKKLRVTVPAKSSMYPRSKKTANLVHDQLRSILTRMSLQGTSGYQRTDEIAVAPESNVAAEITISSANDSEILATPQPRKTYKKSRKPHKFMLRTIPSIRCKKCNLEISNNASSKLLHSLQHLKVSQHIGVYSCLVCSKNDLTLQELCDHLHDEHKLKPVAHKTYETKFRDCAAMVRFMMDQCFLLAAKGTVRATNNETSWTSTKIQCTKCSLEISPSTSSQLNHVYEHLQRETEFQWMYKCLICPYFATMEQAVLRKHMNAMHSDIKELIYGVHYVDNTFETVIPLRQMELACFQNKSQFSAPSTPPTIRSSMKKL